MTLLAGLADAHPEWQLILVGPVVKIGVADLPQRPNIHYLGQQPYADLPRFLAGWDVCLLPFARNESTRFISPTKTLEYMAAELPIVSTDIADVIELYGEAVAVAKDANEFIAACESALQATQQQRTVKIEAMRRLVAPVPGRIPRNVCVACLRRSKLTRLLLAERDRGANHRLKTARPGCPATMKLKRCFPFPTLNAWIQRRFVSERTDRLDGSSKGKLSSLLPLVLFSIRT